MDDSTVAKSVFSDESTVQQDPPESDLLNGTPRRQ